LIDNYNKTRKEDFLKLLNNKTEGSYLISKFSGNKVKKFKHEYVKDTNPYLVNFKDIKNNY
jgi:hypothetical protein